MEVHVRNVPVQGTERGLTKFLKPHLDRLSIKHFHCQKMRDKPFASLTFLSIVDGQKFLDRYEQIRLAPGAARRRPNANASVPLKLTFLNRPIYPEKSFRSPDMYLLRVLQTEAKKAAKSGSEHVLEHSPSYFPIEFKCESVSCGIRSYHNGDLVFAPQLTWNIRGTARFVQRALIVKLVSNQRIDFRYFGASEITMEDGAFILSMQEPPHFFELMKEDPVAALFAGLAISPIPQPPQRRGTDRVRCPSFDENHRDLVGNCLVYRIGLMRSNILSDRHLKQTLQKALPQIVNRRTEIVSWPEPFAIGLKRLQQTLSSSFGLNLLFPIVFQIQKLVQNAYLAPNTVADLIPTIKEITERSGEQVCVAALKKLFPTIPHPSLDVDPTEYQLDTLVNRLEDKENVCKREGLLLEAAQMSGNVALIHRAKITPSSVFLYGPDPETTNRVLRKYADYHDYFLRVQFCDEDGGQVQFNSRVSNYKIYHQRFKDILTNGIMIGDRKYGFLGFSHSSLRAQSCWFVAPFVFEGGLVWDRVIIRQLGDFENIRSPAKCAARIGQTFSDTPTTVQINPLSVTLEEDVEMNNRVFSDGVGTLSIDLMEKIWGKLTKASRKFPTCFQIRYAGAKGMISLDVRLRGELLVLRPSMIKFEGTNKTDIEICEIAYRPLPAYLNRQFIKILEDMGVSQSFFLKEQRKEVDRLRMVADSPMNASTFLKRQSIGDSFQLPWFITNLALHGFDFRMDGFLRNVLELTLLNELRMLKHKTRIPVENGWHLHGIMDEFGILEEGQVYCTVRVNGINTPVVGKNLVISRAPALHPGDVQLVEGILVPDNSPLAQLANCVVFSRKGFRDLPSQLSGGDLDGDRYYIIYDEACRPTRTFEPADYPRQAPLDIGRVVTAVDMTDFFITFMETDQLGRIAVLHRVLADQKEEGTLHEDCITLAEMHSTAVDFSKTGIPVDLSKMPRYNPWRPDFEAPGPYVAIEKNEEIFFDPPKTSSLDFGDEDDDFPGYRYYESNKILGKLYRAIDERKIYEEIKQRSHIGGSDFSARFMKMVWKFVERKVTLIQWEHLKEWAWDLREQYEESFLNIMTEYSDHPLRPLSEVEVFVGNILGRTGAQSKRQRELSTSLKEKFELDSAFFVNCILKDGDEWSEQALERSIACFAISLENREGGVRRGEELLSFKYVAAATCLREVERSLDGY